MPAVWLTFRTDLRSRWLAWAAMGALIGLLGGLVLAAAAGARRTEAAYPQLVAASNQADALIFDTEPNPQVPPISSTRVESLTQVAEAGHLRAFETRDRLTPSAARPVTPTWRPPESAARTWCPDVPSALASGAK